jgi:hypothetical protein
VITEGVTPSLHIMQLGHGRPDQPGTDSRSSRSRRAVVSSAAVVALTGRGWSANAIAVRFSRGAMFSARRRAGRREPSTVEPVITEAEYYPGG